MTKFLKVCSFLLIAVVSVTAQEHRSNTSRANSSSSSDPASSWARLDSEEGGFSILLPKLVTDQTETKQSVNGPYTTHLFIVNTTKGVFLVGWVDYDPSFNFSVQSELEANRDNFVKGVKATLLNTTRIALDGNPGLEFTSETQNMFYKSRVYIIGRRPLLLIAGTNSGMDDSPNVARFFSSFKIKLP
jgi:hypothetical protein